MRNLMGWKCQEGIKQLDTICREIEDWEKMAEAPNGASKELAEYNLRRLHEQKRYWQAAAGKSLAEDMYSWKDSMSADELIECLGTYVGEPSSPSLARMTGAMWVRDGRGHKYPYHGVSFQENQRFIGKYGSPNNGRTTLHTKNGPISIPVIPMILEILNRNGYELDEEATGSTLDGVEPLGENAGKFLVAQQCVHELINIAHMDQGM